MPFPTPVKSHQQKPFSPSTPPRETTAGLDGKKGSGKIHFFFVRGQAAKLHEPETASLSNQSLE